MSTGTTSEGSGEPRMVNAEQVSRSRAAMPATRDIVDLADVFHLLGDPNRVRILIVLADGRMAVRDIAAVVELSESAISHALRLLRAHRVVDVEREGRVAYYALADAHVRELLRLALEHVGHTVLLHTAEAAIPAASGELDHQHHTQET